METTTPSPSAAPAASAPPSSSSRAKTTLVLLLFGLLALLGAGLLFAFSRTSAAPVGAGWFLFSYTMGLTMIVLPCTFPLAFVIVPLAMGKGPTKGFAIALAFGAGVAVTLSMYGVIAAIVGKVAIGTLNAPLETVKNWLYAIAGIFAYIFALGELGFVRFRMPTYSGAAPMFIQKQGDVLKALLLGLFMGNIGVGCPHPATPLILTRIATSGDVFYGWLLFFVHALGRITPLLILAILGILGVNALSWIVKRRTVIENATGWAMVFVAAFIFTLGFFTHDWWVYSGQHVLLEKVTKEEQYLNVLGAKLGTGNAHHHGLPTGTGLFGLPLWLGDWALWFLWIAPMLWYVVRRQDRIAGRSPPEQEKELAVMPWLKAFVVTLAVLLGSLVIWAIPHQFLKHWAVEGEGGHGEHMTAGQQHVVAVTQTSDPAAITAGEPATLRFTFPGSSLSDFSIEHDRLIHLVIIREDLKTFAHIHLEPVMESPATFEVTHTFPFSGRYLLALNYVHQGAEESWRGTISVSGNDSVIVDQDFSLTKQFGPYSVALALEPQLPRAGKTAHLRWTLKSQGEPVTDLSPYLAAPAHIAVVREDFGYFLHTHGEVPADGPTASTIIPIASAHGDDGETMEMHGSEHGVIPVAFGPNVDADVSFPEPGTYKIFTEFARGKEMILTDFLITVSGGR